MVTTDGFTVRPLEFPGGDTGALAVHGTVNDLAVAGATPLYITLNTFIEEGLEVALLDRIVASLARARPPGRPGGAVIGEIVAPRPGHAADRAGRGASAGGAGGRSPAEDLLIRRGGSRSAGVRSSQVRARLRARR